MQYLNRPVQTPLPVIGDNLAIPWNDIMSHCCIKLSLYCMSYYHYVVLLESTQRKHDRLVPKLRKGSINNIAVDYSGY